jgi:hypothetical protein
MALQSILSVVLHAFATANVVDPHQSKKFVVAGAISHARCDQPWLSLPTIQQKEILSSLQFLALQRRMQNLYHHVDDVIMLR